MTEENEKKEVENKKKKKDQITLKPDSPVLEFIRFFITAIYFFDFMLQKPFEVLYQEKTLGKFNEQIVQQLLDNSKSFQQIYDHFKFDELVADILNAAKQRAVNAGFTESMTNKARKLTLPVYIAVIGVFIVIMALQFIGIDFGNYLWFILLPVMLIPCLLPTVVNYFFQKKWIAFIDSNMQEFLTEKVNELKKGREFIQKLINETHDLLIENKLDGRRFRFMVFRTDYENLNIIEERTQRGTTFYVAEFTTPQFESESGPRSDDEDEDTEEDDIEEFDEDFDEKEDE